MDQLPQVAWKGHLKTVISNYRQEVCMSHMTAQDSGCRAREQFLYGVFAAATLRAAVDVSFTETEQDAYCLSYSNSPRWGSGYRGLSRRLLSPARPTYCCEQVLAHGPQESRGPRGEPYSRVDDEFTGLAQVLGQQGPPHVTAQCVLEKQERKTSPQWTWFLSRHNTQSNKQSAILRTL